MRMYAMWHVPHYVLLLFNIVSALFTFISFQVYVINFIIISLKTLYNNIAPIYICPLTHVLILDSSIINTYANIIDCL